MNLKRSRKHLIIKYIPFFVILLILGWKLFIYDNFINSFSIAFYIITYIPLIYSIERDSRYGKGILDYKIETQNKVKEIFQNRIEEEFYNLFHILGNKSLFHLFNIELFLASNKYDWDDKNRFFRKEKGWHKSYRSSKQAILRYSNKYQEIYEGRFLFLITFLTTIILLRNDFYTRLIESYIKKKPISLQKRTIQYVIPKVHEKIVNCDQEFINNVISSNKKKYSFLRYTYTPLNRTNLEIDRESTITFFRKVNMDPKVINFLSNISLEEYSQMKKLQAYFRNLLYSKDCPINEKLNYLKENGYDFTSWINSMLRNKFVHHLNFIFVKNADKTCGFKIIFGKFKNLVLNASDYYKGLSEIYAISDFLYIQLFNTPSRKDDEKGWKFSGDLAIKILRNPKLNIP